MLETTLWDRFKLLMPLGSGGFGETYLAEDRHLNNQKCVVKHFKPRKLHPEVLQKAKELFEREASVLDKLGGQHKQIPRLLAHFDLEIEGNREFFLVQEFVEGRDLTHEIREGQPLPEEKVVSILQDVLQTLEFVHQQGAIHRDIKPANLIRRDQDQKIVLIDFGAVKQNVKDYLAPSHTATTLIPNSVSAPLSETNEASETEHGSTIIGSPGYVAPEQLRAKPKLASDIYSLGMMGIAALTGVQPRDLPEDSKTGETVWRDRATVNPKLADVLDKMVRYRWSERYQTATEALQALNQVLVEPEPEPEPPAPVPAPLHLSPAPPLAPSTRPKLPVLLPIAAVGALLLGSAGYWIYSQRPVATGQTVAEGCPVADVPTGLFNYGGSTTWAPIQRDVNPKLEDLCSNFRLRYTDPPGGEVPGSSAGIRMLQQGQIDFALSSRPLEANETQDNQGAMLKQVDVAIDGIVFAVHPNLDLPGLTVEQVRDIYTGQIANWQEVGGPDRPITPYSRRLEAGGTVDFFVQNILEGQAIKAELVSRTTEGIQKVSTDPGGIYYASAPEVVGQCGVKPLPIGRQPDQFVVPYQEPLVPSAECPAKRNQVNLETFQSGDYPITRKLFVIVKENGADEQQAGESYSDFLLTPEGQALIEQAGFVRIR